MRGLAPTISSNASAALTLCQSRPESLLWLHSFMKASHNEVTACCSWLMLLYIEVVDRYANQRGFLSLLLQCRDKKPSFMRAKQLTDLRNQQAAFLTPLFYSKESQNVSQGLGEWNLSDHEQALIGGSRSLPLETHGTNFPQLTRNKRKTQQPCTNLQPAVVQAVKCPGLNNTNCGVSYTSIGAPASSLSSCSFNSAICSCRDWSIKCVATVWNGRAIALTREYGLLRLSMASKINSFASSGVA